MPNHSLVEIQMLLERQVELRRATERAGRRAPDRSSERNVRPSRLAPGLQPAIQRPA